MSDPTLLNHSLRELADYKADWRLVISKSMSYYYYYYYYTTSYLRNHNSLKCYHANLHHLMCVLTRHGKEKEKLDG